MGAEAGRRPPSFSCSESSTLARRQEAAAARAWCRATTYSARRRSRPGCRSRRLRRDQPPPGSIGAPPVPVRRLTGTDRGQDASPEAATDATRPHGKRIGSGHLGHTPARHPGRGRRNRPPTPGADRFSPIAPARLRDSELTMRVRSPSPLNGPWAPGRRRGRASVAAPCSPGRADVTATSGPSRWSTASHTRSWSRPRWLRLIGRR